jgi:hypothetical protein
MDRMRPAHDTCEHCHSPERARADRLKVIRHYDNDERSTEKITVLLMRTTKIHDSHVQPDIEYAGAESDAQTISAVTAGDRSYSVEGAKAAASPTRRMDCLDCHNRSGHDFETPESVVDQAIAAGKLDRSKPFARRDAVAALKSQATLAEQPAAVRTMFSENVFPEMMVSWGTYPNNIGHENFPGCFRCHDGQHVTKTGDPITQDCGSCHELVAVDEKSPQILKDLGLQ